ncbi:MAG: M48 family metallopeptidase [Blastocatellia bacterium]
MKTTSAGQILVLILMASLGTTVLAFQNPYDKFRNREYSNAGFISEEEEMKLAEQVHGQVIKEYRLIQNQPVNAYITNLGNKLARRSERPNLRWTFYVVDDKSVNAFATLGGRVYIHTGLIATTTSEAQLASVMGHEIGHIVGRHGLENVKRAQKIGIGAAAASIIGAIIGGRVGSVVDLAGNLIAGGYLMKHSRDAEREADFLGLYNLEQASYNTREMISMFEILNRLSQSQPNSIGSIMASHPAPVERARNTQREIEEHLGSSRDGITTSNDYARIRAGLVGGTGSRIRQSRPRG